VSQSVAEAQYFAALGLILLVIAYQIWRHRWNPKRLFGHRHARVPVKLSVKNYHVYAINTSRCNRCAYHRSQCNRGDQAFHWTSL